MTAGPVHPEWPPGKTPAPVRARPSAPLPYQSPPQHAAQPAPAPAQQQVGLRCTAGCPATADTQPRRQASRTGAGRVRTTVSAAARRREMVRAGAQDTDIYKDKPRVRFVLWYAFWYQYNHTTITLSSSGSYMHSTTTILLAQNTLPSYESCIYTGYQYVS
jgi:hypothetical protein